MRRTVLVACDSADDDAVSFARLVARLLDAGIALVHIRATESLTGVEPDPSPSRAPRAEARVLSASSAAAGLQKLIVDERPLLTVLGSAHDAGHGRVRVGSTGERVLHGAECPVAVVPRGHGERALTTVGVGLLPSADSRRALRAGAALARAAGAPLLVLVVLRRSPSPADAAALAARLAPTLTFRSAGAPAEILRAAIIAAARENDAEPDGWASSGELEVEPLILIGDAPDALLRASSRLGVLVLGSRAYGPPGVVLPGGAAGQVLANARCPVLMVPRAPVAVRVPA